MRQLFDGQAIDGTSTRMAWIGGPGTAKISGTWDGATVTLVGAETGGTLISLGSDAVLTADGIVNFSLYPKQGEGTMDVAFVMSSAGASTVIDAFIGEDRLRV